ncbi:MAG: TonB-dependent receptor [Chitinophagaceae bacterium]|nr:TonB-dependent receptor [Chitinophagaceae bacterium]
MNISKSILTIILILSSFTVFSQGGNVPVGEIYGNIVDSASNNPFSYAIIKVLDSESGKLVGGATTSETGDFSVEGLSNGKYTVEISFIGYKTKTINDVVLSKKKASFQLQDVQLASTSQQLKEAVIFSGRPEITYEIDKKVVNVEDMQNTAGQTASEVLANIPSIVVASDGTVSLRGSSSFTLLIDGVPTILEPSDALAQIPASSIQDIEIITNPSAKFNAEGTAGVINIITKKSKLRGVSSLVNATAGTFDNYNGNGAFSVKNNKTAFDLNADFRRANNPDDRTENRQTTYDSLTNDLNSRGVGGRVRNGWGVGAGFQWTPNAAHTLVVKTDYNKRYMKFFEEHNFENYNDGMLMETFFTDDRTEVDMWSSSNSLVYRHNIQRNKDHYISVGAIANLRYVDQVDSTLSYNNNGQLIRGNTYTELGPSNMYRFNLDYVRPIKDKYKFETGLQAQFGRSFDDGDNYQYDNITGVYNYLPLFSSDVNYIRDVHAAYALFGGQVKRIGFQGGLRAEYTYRTVKSVNFPASTTINRLNLFPSVHMSYSFENESQVLLSYSRRIERPRSWYFEPFVTWESIYGVRGGNPDLNPTYITVVDFSYMYPFGQKGYWSLEAYYRRSVGTIQWVQSTYQPGILIKQPYNIGLGQRIGTEAALNYRFTKWYQLNLGLNAYYYDLSSSIKGQDYSANSFNYNINLRNTFTIKEWALQLNGRYRSGSVEPQGKSLSGLICDVSLKKSFYKNKLTFNLNALNAFLTDRNINYVYTDNVTIYDTRIPQGPMLSLTVSLKLNNYEKLYKQEQLDDF